MAEEYLRFVQTGDTGKTKTWDIVSIHHGNVLGRVRWYGGWRQYVFYPEPQTLWNDGCLETVRRFLREQMAARRLA